MAKIQILHVIKSLGRGGAEMLLPSMVASHNQDRFEFHCVYFLPWKDQVVSQIKQAGSKVTCIPAKSNLGILAKSGALRRYCRENRIDLIHAHLPWAGVASRFAALGTGIPVVYTEHNNFDRYHLMTKAISWATFGMQQKVISVSQDAKDALMRRKLHKDIEYVPNGVDTTWFAAESRTPRERLVIGTVAVFRKQKRLEKFIEVARISQDKGYPWDFELIGDGPERAHLQNLVEQYQLKNVVFHGMQQDPRAYLKEMDLFLITSDFEGLPVALLESMSMEVIPVSTKVGGIPNVVQDGVNGLLLDSDSPMAIAERISQFYQHDFHDFSRFRTAARNAIQQDYSIQKMVNRLETIYDTVLSD